MEFTNKIKQWVTIDNRVRVLNEEIKAMRTTRSELAENIMELAEKNNLGNPTIQITDGKLRFNDIKISTPLTFKFLKKCLQNCISDENTVEKIMIYIKENREFRYTKDIRRTYSNNT